MNFLVVCRDEPYGFESLLTEVETRSVPTSEPFKGRKLKASESCERAIVVIDTALVLSGWFSSGEWTGLCERAAEGLPVLAIRIGLAPCPVPAIVQLVDSSDARTALRRFLVDQPLQLVRPRTVLELDSWTDASARIHRGEDADTVLGELDLTDDTLATGRIVQGRYRLIEDLRPDALFSNWYAHDLHNGGIVLYRVCHPHERARAEAVEATLPVWEGLDHPSIASLLEYGDRNGSLWFASQIVGEPLAGLVEADAVDGDRILLAALDIATALTTAHAAGVVHGAVDPGRIHLATNGQTLLSDFGVAAITRGSRDAVVYAAPETLAPDAKPQISNDIYGLAMVVLLGLHGSALPYWVLRDANRLINDLLLPRELEVALRAALDWVPEQRPTSVDELVQAILADASLAVRLADRALQLKQLDTVERILASLETHETAPADATRLRLAVARVRASEGDPVTAVATLTGLAEEADDPADIWLEIATIQQETNDTAGAIQSSESALETHTARRQAVQALRVLLDLDPDRFARWGRTLALYTDGNEKGEVAWRLGKVFHESGDDAAALLWLDRAASAGIDTDELSGMRKQIRAARGDWNDVVGMMVTHASEGDDPIEALEQAARIARRAAGPEVLDTIHERLLELEPSHAPSLRHQIRAAARERATEEVLRLERLLCASENATAGDQAAHARKLLASGDWEGAVDAADAALTLEPGHLVALRVAGRAAQDGGRFESAVQHRRRLIDLQATGASVAQADRYAQLGDLERFHGDPDAAEVSYDEALNINPHHLRAWWGLYVVERGRLPEDGGVPPAPVRFGPHEALARLFADVLQRGAIESALAMDSFGRALALDTTTSWQRASRVVDLLAYREAIGPQLFDRLLDAFPQRIVEISAVQALWSGSAQHTGSFPIADAAGWAQDGPDFDAGAHRELLFCSSWPTEVGHLDPRVLEVLFQRDTPLVERPRSTELDDDEDLLLESPEVPVLLVGSGSDQRQVEIEADLLLTSATLPALPGALSVHRHGDQIYLAVEDGALEVGSRKAGEVRLTGGDKLSWHGTAIEFYRVQDPSTLGESATPEITVPRAEPIPGVAPVQLEALDPDEPSLIWATEKGEFGIQLDVRSLMVVAGPGGSLVFTQEDVDAYLAVIMNRGGDCYIEENLTHDSGFGGRLSARALIPGESLKIGGQSVVFRAPGKGLASLDMPSPRARRPYLVLMDGSQNGRPVPITRTPFKLGRGRGCELQIRTDGLLSRVHCLIEARDTGYTVRDAGSSNGTRLNDKPVTGQATPLSEGDRVSIGHTTLVFTRTVIGEELSDRDESTEEATVDQDHVETRNWTDASALPLHGVFDEDMPEVQRKVTIANRALAVLAVALDGQEGPGRTRTEIQLLIDAGDKEFQGLFDGIELSAANLPWDSIDDALADRPERRRAQALSTGLIALVDRTTDRVCELLSPQAVDEVLADIAVIGHRRDLQF